MCDARILSLIEDVASEKVSSNELFTAFDVSIAVRNRATASSLSPPRHREIKNDVHRVLDTHLQNGNYKRDLRDVGAPTPAFVYYPVGSDPSTYVSGVNGAVAAPVVSAVVNAPVSSVNTPLNTPVQSTVDDDDGDGKDVGRGCDARGSLCVPTFMLRQVGLKPDDSAVVSMENINNSVRILVGKDVPASATQLTSYTVDYHGNVRITQTPLSAAFGSDANNNPKYDFEVVGDKVLVKLTS